MIEGEFIPIPTSLSRGILEFSNAKLGWTDKGNYHAIRRTAAGY